MAHPRILQAFSAFYNHPRMHFRPRLEGNRLHPRLGLRNPRFRQRVWIFEGPVGQVFDGFGVFREVREGQGWSRTSLDDF